ncbi:ComEC/Rec2 family competence protein [Winogradskyella sp.]|uniref:ComEC/Rec2 family competence protein n=1 Tax=Winogradskyella sp. TaxID=1883156 RepID=UPI003F6AEA81
MKLLNFTIIKLTIALVIGILLAHYFEIDFSIVLSSTIALVFSVGIYWYFLKFKIDRFPFFGALTYLALIGIGMTVYQIQNDRVQSDHYTHQIQKHNTAEFLLKIEERLKPDTYNDKYFASIQSINGQHASGRLLVNIKKDSLNNNLAIDDIIFTSAVIKDIQKPLNPHQFDYRNYLKLKQVYHQLYLTQDKLLTISNDKTSIYGYADAFRSSINERLIKAGFKDDTLSIINALLLGQRQNLDKTIYNNYVNAGTIHILAVSGLHVGVILLILNFLFRPLLYLKYGNTLRPLLIVILLWSFAVIAGLSPSVTRAVAMFSIISVAMHLKRPTNIYNTLVISAFLILLVKPNFLFEVGFQMSYLAVLGIVSIQPILYKQLKPKYWLTDKLWQIFTVTLAAQFGVVPISLFYFHQFPGLFFISNIVVIPFLGLILGFGLLIIVLSLLNYLPEFVVTTYSFIIESLNGFIAWIAQFEEFLFRDIPFIFIQVVFSYLIVVSLVQVYKFRTFKWVAMCLITVLCLQVISFYNSYKTQNETFVVFNKSRYSILGHKLNDKLLVYHNLDSVKLKTDNTVKNFSVGESITTIELDSVATVYNFKNQTLLVIDSLAIYKGISFKPDYVLLRNSPRFNLNRMIDSLNPKKIIADASNFKSYVKRWQATCRDEKIPFHYTNEKGAFILR